MAMKELITKIQESYQAFVKDANLQVENGNKAAGVRARKASLEGISQSISRKREEIIGTGLTVFRTCHTASTNTNEREKRA